MKVSDLIDYLQQFSPDALVLANEDEYDGEPENYVDLSVIPSQFAAMSEAEPERGETFHIRGRIHTIEGKPNCDMLTDAVVHALAAANEHAEWVVIEDAPDTATNERAE